MKPKSNRPPFAQRQFRLVSEETRERAINALRNLPIDAIRPIEVVLREEQKRRSLDANAALWAGPLRDISEQAWLDNKQFAPEVWAHWFKVQLLPEEYDPELCMEGYVKWSYDPSGDRVLVGSTTQLTRKGHARYREEMEAYGAGLGVQFSVRAPE